MPLQIQRTEVEYIDLKMYQFEDLKMEFVHLAKLFSRPQIFKFSN